MSLETIEEITSVIESGKIPTLEQLIMWGFGISSLNKLLRNKPSRFGKLAQFGRFMSFDAKFGYALNPISILAMVGSKGEPAEYTPTAGRTVQLTYEDMIYEFELSGGTGAFEAGLENAMSNLTAFGNTMRQSFTSVQGMMWGMQDLVLPSEWTQFADDYLGFGNSPTERGSFSGSRFADDLMRLNPKMWWLAPLNVASDYSAKVVDVVSPLLEFTGIIKYYLEMPGSVYDSLADLTPSEIDQLLTLKMDDLSKYLLDKGINVSGLLSRLESVLGRSDEYVGMALAYWWHAFRNMSKETRAKLLEIVNTTHTSLRTAKKIGTVIKLPREIMQKLLTINQPDPANPLHYVQDPDTGEWTIPMVPGTLMPGFFGEILRNLPVFSPGGLEFPSDKPKIDPTTGEYEII